MKCFNRKCSRWNRRGNGRVSWHRLCGHAEAHIFERKRGWSGDRGGGYDIAVYENVGSDEAPMFRTTADTLRPTLAQAKQVADRELRRVCRSSKRDRGMV